MKSLLCMLCVAWCNVTKLYMYGLVYFPQHHPVGLSMESQCVSYEVGAECLNK
jgi:hypothetical protein